MTYCGECGQPLNAEARFCAACGADASGGTPGGQDEPEVTVRLFSRPDPRSGEIVGDFELVREIARGGMGVVYLARQRRLDRDAAIKLISPELARDPVFRERFRSEALLAGSLSHPHIVPVYDADEANGELYIAMRYVAGTDLGSLIAKEGPLEPARAAQIVSQVGAALDAAHARGLVHRDVKPANILIESPGPGEIAYLTDFGLLKPLDEESGLTRGDQWMGTIHYAAPEQIAGNRIDGRADLYALGGVLYKALTGQVPFPRETPTAAMWAHVHTPPPSAAQGHAGVGPQFDSVIRRAMAKEPSGRFATGAELGDAALAAARGGGDWGAQAPGPAGHQQLGGFTPTGNQQLGTIPLDGDSSAFSAGHATGIQATPPERPRQVIVEPQPEKRGPRRRSVLIACLMLSLLLAGGALAVVLTGALGGDSRAEQVGRAKDQSRILLKHSDDLTKEMAGLTHDLRGNPSPAERKRIRDRLATLDGKAHDLGQQATATAAGPGGDDPAVAYANKLIKQIADNQAAFTRKLAAIARNPHDPRLNAFITDLQAIIAENRRKARQGSGYLDGGHTPPELPTLRPPVTAAGAPPTPAPPPVASAQAWKQLADGPGDLDPSALASQPTTFDGTLMEPIVVFAPAGASDPSSCGSGQLETWALNATSWKAVDTATAPPDCPVAGIAYDSANSETVLVLAPHGEPTQTWTFDGADWTDAQDATALPNVGPLVYDTSNARLLMVGRGSGSSWTWDGTDWSEAGDGSGLDVAAASYSPMDGAVVAVGPGSDDLGGAQRTVAFEGSTWTDLAGGGNPPRAGALATDFVNQNLLLVPPTDPAQADSTAEFEQWHWTGSIWKRETSSTAPSPMSSLATSVDTETAGIYVLGFPGAQEAAHATSETWVYEKTSLTHCGGETPLDGLAPGAVASNIIADGVGCPDARTLAAALSTLGDNYHSGGFKCEAQNSLDTATSQGFNYRCVAGHKSVRFAATE
jgi:serine/threonine protein kinase